MGDDLLPDELKSARPKIKNTQDTIKELLRAMTLVEYEQFHREEGKKFINSEITYDEYIKSTSSYASIADRVYLEIDNVT